MLRDGVEYTAVSVLVNPSTTTRRARALDAAVLVMDQVIPVRRHCSKVFPAQGPVTLAGFQPLEPTARYYAALVTTTGLTAGRTGGVVKIETAAAGCVHLVSELEITTPGEGCPAA